MHISEGVLSSPILLTGTAIDINLDIEFKKFNGLAQIYMREGDYDKAEKLLLKSIENFPYDNKARELLVRVRQKKGEKN